MSYTPPAGNVVNFAFGRTPNATTSPVAFVFGGSGTLSVSAAQTVQQAIQAATLQTVALPTISLSAAQSTDRAVQISTLQGLASVVADQAVLQSAQTATINVISTRSLVANQLTQQATQAAALNLIALLSAGQLAAPAAQSASISALAKLIAEQSALAPQQLAQLGASARVSADQLMLLSVQNATISVTPLGPLSLYADQIAPAGMLAAFIGSLLFDRNGRTYIVRAQRRGFIVEPQARLLEL